MIKVIAIGKIKEKYLNDLIEDYKTRISKYHKIELIELKEGLTIEKEATDILKYINEKDFCIACAIEGNKMTSTEFAKLIDQTFLNAGTITFVIGSSCGLSKEVKDRANLLLSFSDFTMPHGLFRGVLLEQIYRAFKINNNEKYHK